MTTVLTTSNLNKMKLILLCSFVLLLTSSKGQLIQGTIKSGTAANQIEIWLKPNFNNGTQYLYQVCFPISFPASVSPLPTSLSVSLDAGFISAFGNNYTSAVYPLSQNTAGTEKYFNIILIRSGSGASNAQSWTSGTEFKVLTATFPDSLTTALVKLADYQDGGYDGQGNFYTVDGSANYYVTSNSVGNFYSTTSQSQTGGNSSVGYVQTISNISLRVNPQQPVKENNPEDKKASFLTITGVHPNPVHSEVNLTYIATKKGRNIYLISDVNGRIIRQENLQTEKGLNKITIQTRELANGAYIIKLMCPDKGCETSKEIFIKI